MHFRLIDGNSMGHTQFHGQPSRLTPAGEPCQATFGSLNALKNLLYKTPDVVNLFLWDGRAQWRYDLYPSYKSNRLATPLQKAQREDYDRQKQVLQLALKRFPVIQLRHPGAEADDLAWGLTQQLADQGHMVTLLTTDTDWLQFVQARVRWQNIRAPYQRVEFEGFSKASGGFFTPEQVPQVKALAGDTADCIPGLDGIAHVRALALLGKYQALDSLLQAAENFIEFSREPEYAHVLMLPESVSTVRRNFQLISLAHGPRLHGDAVQVEHGVAEELDVYETLLDLGAEDALESFGSWQRALAAAVPSGATYAVDKAVRKLSSSWPG